MPGADIDPGRPQASQAEWIANFATATARERRRRMFGVAASFAVLSAATMAFATTLGDIGHFAGAVGLAAMLLGATALVAWRAGGRGS